MSKEIEIKGRKFSEETIIEALKAHTDWPKRRTFRHGDIVSFKGGDNGVRRLVVKDDNGVLVSITCEGKILARDKDINETLYTYVGRCVGFKVEE